MKIASFRNNELDHVGVALDEGHILALDKEMVSSAGVSGLGGALPQLSVDDILQGGDAALQAIDTLTARARAGEFAERIVACDVVTFLSPIPKLRKNIFCVGRNYREHVSEGYRARGEDAKYPQHPQFFTKPPTTVIGHGAGIPLHSATSKLDYEVELGIVIGQSGRDISEEDALGHIFGYTIINDITARDLQRLHDQWFKGKALDGSCPIGPWLVPAASIGDPQHLDIALSVNGEERQRSNTANMIFPIRRIIADLSRGLTLEAGDVIATGTPSGVGYAMSPPHFLASGDVVSCFVEGIGTLTNKVV